MFFSSRFSARTFSQLWQSHDDDDDDDDDEDDDDEPSGFESLSEFEDSESELVEPEMVETVSAAVFDISGH